MATLGARFAQFGSAAERLRTARLTTLGNTLALALKHEADAKEQLLLCLHLAVAQELSIDEPQVLILDVLGTQAARLQILILTCHPDRYRGVGQGIAITG